MLPSYYAARQVAAVQESGRKMHSTRYAAKMDLLLHSQLNRVPPVTAVGVGQWCELVLLDFADQPVDVEGIEGGSLCCQLIEHTAKGPATRVAAEQQCHGGRPQRETRQHKTVWGRMAHPPLWPAA